jgi:hypothetical protein
MGSYLIPNALSVQEAADHIGTPNLTSSWERAENGVLFKDTSRTDAQCAALYTDYTPSGADDFIYEKPLPQPVVEAMATCKAFYDTNPATLTAVQIVALHRAQVTILRWMNRKMQE